MVERKSTLEPVRHVAAHELVLEQLRRAMEAGQFRPGDRLPSERELADMLQVSRMTVRTAIVVLEREGRIVVRRGRSGGFIVQPLSQSPAEIRQILRAHRAAVFDALDFRVIVEVAAARRAAEFRRKKDISSLRSLVAQMDNALEVSLANQTPHNVFEFETLDSTFHEAVAIAAKNESLREAVTSTRPKMWAPVGSIFWRVEENAHEHHATIVDAIENSDPDAAAKAMQEHIADTRENIDKWIRR